MRTGEKLLIAYNINTRYGSIEATLYSDLVLSEACFIPITVGLPLNDWYNHSEQAVNLSKEEGMIMIQRDNKLVNVNQYGANSYKICYKDIFEGGELLMHSVNRVYNYIIKKKDCPNRNIRISSGKIFNESNELLLIITKSIYDTSYTLYLSTDLLNLPIYKSLLTRVKKELIKPFEEKDFTIVTMNIQKLTNLFYPKYEDEVMAGEVPETILL